MCIYIDVLIITNIYITWFVILAVSRIIHTKVEGVRLVVSSFTGGLSSFIIILELEGVSSGMVFILKIIMFLIINRIAFSEKSFFRLLRISFISFIVNLIYCAVAYFIKEILSLRAVYIDGFTMYFQLSMPILISSTVIAYLIVSLTFYIIERKENKSLHFEVYLEIDDFVYSCNAVSDSGNNVIDIFNGKSVVVISNDELLERVQKQNLQLKGFRIIPYSTVSSNGVLPVFYPSKLCITSSSGKKYFPDAMVGVVSDKSSGKRAVFNPRILFE